MIFIKRKKSKLKLRSLLTTNWLILLFLLTFFLRLPSLFEPFTYGDEGIYLTLGQAVRRGLVLYRDIHDNKPPLLYLIAALAGSFSYFRLILFLWSFATIYLFKKLAELLFKQEQGIKIATLTFAILSSIHTFEGNVANAENFMLLPTIAGFYLIFKIFSLKLSHRLSTFAHTRCVIGAGLLFGLATLFKIPAAFDFAAALVFVLLATKIRNLKLEIRNYLLLLLGFLLPLLLTFIYFASKDALNQYFVAAFAQNIPYLSSWSANRPQIVGLPLPLIARAGFVLIVIIFLFAFRRKLSKPFIVATTWFSFALFAALLSSRPYPHYLLQTIPSLALAFGLIKVKTKEKLLPIVSLAVLLFTFILFKFWLYPNTTYYLNFYQYLFQLKDKENYFASFDNQANYLYQTATFIKTHTQKDEPVFIWSNQPSLYALAERPVVGRYTAAYHIIDFNGYQETMAQLEKQSPKYIIVNQEEKRPFSEFFTWLEQKYTLEKQIGNFQIYHRLL